MAMSLQDAFKQMIQAYFDGNEASGAADNKYNKSYLDNFHKAQTSSSDVATGKKHVKAELLKADNLTPPTAASIAPDQMRGA